MPPHREIPRTSAGAVDVLQAIPLGIVKCQTAEVDQRQCSRISGDYEIFVIARVFDAQLRFRRLQEQPEFLFGTVARVKPTNDARLGPDGPARRASSTPRERRQMDRSPRAPALTNERPNCRAAAPLNQVLASSSEVIQRALSSSLGTRSTTPARSSRAAAASAGCSTCVGRQRQSR